MVEILRCHRSKAACDGIFHGLPRFSLSLFASLLQERLKERLGQCGALLNTWIKYIQSNLKLFSNSELNIPMLTACRRNLYFRKSCSNWTLQGQHGVLRPLLSTPLCPFQLVPNSVMCLARSLHKSLLILAPKCYYFRKREEYQILNRHKHPHNWILVYSSPRSPATGF